MCRKKTILLLCLSKILLLYLLNGTQILRRSFDHFHKNSFFLFTVFFFAVCKALKAGMAGLFGPQSSSTSSHVQSICDTLEIPHIETRWDYRMKREDYSVNLYPHPLALGQVSARLVVPGRTFGILWDWCSLQGRPKMFWSGHFMVAGRSPKTRSPKARSSEVWRP